MNNDCKTQLDRIEEKIDLLLDAKKYKIGDQQYIKARDVSELTGLNYRTVLNRSNLDQDHHLHIPSVQLGNSNRKYFERKVIERIFKLD
ncbi:MAG: hypothetical protein U5J63_09475 [Fodinibius sp.]|nr:hypothetical protein [Fodinibius sp.]